MPPLHAPGRQGIVQITIGTVTGQDGVRRRLYLHAACGTTHGVDDAVEGSDGWNGLFHDLGTQYSDLGLVAEPAADIAGAAVDCRVGRHHLGETGGLAINVLATRRHDLHQVVVLGRGWRTVGGVLVREHGTHGIAETGEVARAGCTPAQA